MSFEVMKVIQIWKMFKNSCKKCFSYFGQHLVNTCWLIQWRWLVKMTHFSKNVILSRNIHGYVRDLGVIRTLFLRHRKVFEVPQQLSIALKAFQSGTRWIYWPNYTWTHHFTVRESKGRVDLRKWPKNRFFKNCSYFHTMIRVVWGRH